MMAKHTEGPWTIEQPMDFELTVVEDDGKDPADWRFIASCCFSDPDDPNPISRAQVEANARLIAAAPELLEALETVRAIITEGAATGFVPTEGDWAQRLFESQALSASAVRKAGGNVFAKARGEA